MRTHALSLALFALASLEFGCASTPPLPPPPPPASMTLTPLPCMPDPYTDPYACGQTGGGYYDSAPYTDYPSLLAPYYPGAFPVSAPPVKQPPAPPTPPGKPPTKPAKPKPQPCPKNDKACP
jgi:hypothetical protein